MANDRCKFCKGSSACAWRCWWKSRYWALKRGRTSKIHLAVDSLGHPLRIIITAGTVNDCTKAIELTENIKAHGLIADRGYDTNAIIENAINSNIEVVIPSKQSRKTQREYDKEVYKRRHLVENAFAILKRWRGIATRYAKNTSSFLSAVQICCIPAWGSL